MATAPTVHGEAVAIRLLDNVRRTLNFNSLGFNPRDEVGNQAASWGTLRPYARHRPDGQRQDHDTRDRALDAE